MRSQTWRGHHQSVRKEIIWQEGVAVSPILMASSLLVTSNTTIITTITTTTFTTITTTTTTFNTKHKTNCKLPHDYASSMLSQFYKFSLSMLYATSRLETTLLLAYVYLVFERPSKETFLAISLNNKLYMAFRCYNKKCTMRGLL